MLEISKGDISRPWSHRWLPPRPDPFFIHKLSLALLSLRLLQFALWLLLSSTGTWSACGLVVSLLLFVEQDFIEVFLGTDKCGNLVVEVAIDVQGQDFEWWVWFDLGLGFHVFFLNFFSFLVLTTWCCALIRCKGVLGCEV